MAPNTKEQPEPRKPLITLLLIDDLILMREALTTAFIKEPSIRIIGFCKDQEDALHQYETLKPDIVLMDINMQPVNGFEIARRILEKHPDARIIGLSIHATLSYATKMMGLGARGYLPKTSSYKDIIKAIKKVYAGETYVHDQLQKDE